jgi:hypothetical protein
MEGRGGWPLGKEEVEEKGWSSPSAARRLEIPEERRR